MFLTLPQLSVALSSEVGQTHLRPTLTLQPGIYITTITVADLSTSTRSNLFDKARHVRLSHDQRGLRESLPRRRNKVEGPQHLLSQHFIQLSLQARREMPTHQALHRKTPSSDSRLSIHGTYKVIPRKTHVIPRMDVLTVMPCCVLVTVCLLAISVLGTLRAWSLAV